jgi:hypothetical protein
LDLFGSAPITILVFGEEKPVVPLIAIPKVEIEQIKDKRKAYG